MPAPSKPIARWSGSVAAATNITSASISVNAGDLLVLCVSAETYWTGAERDLTMAISGGGTWTTDKDQDNGADGGHASIHHLVCPSTASFTIGVQYVTGTGPYRLSAQVYLFAAGSFDSVAPIGATGGATGTTSPLNPTLYTSTVNNSRAVYCGTEYYLAGTVSSSDTYDAATYAGAISVLSAYKAADTATSGTAVAGNFVAASGCYWTWAAVEVKPAAGGGGGLAMAAAAAVVADALANLVQAVSISGASLVVSSGSASMGVGIPIGATAAAIADATGNVRIGITFSAQALAGALATAAASNSIGLVAVGAASADGSGDLSTSSGFSASAVGSALASGNVGLLLGLAGNAQASVLASAAPSVNRPLAAAAQAAALAQAGMRTSIALAGAAIANSVATGAVSFGKVDMAWDASTDPNTTGYFVYWDTVSRGNSDWTLYANSTDVGNVLAHTITGLVVGQTYYVNVSAHGAGGHDEFESGLFGEVQLVAVEYGGSAEALVGSAVNTALGSGALSLNLNLGAGAINSALAAAGLRTQLAVGGAAAQQSDATAALSGIGGGLEANASARAQGAASVRVQVGTSAAALSQAIAAGGMTLLIGLNAAGINSASAGAQLTNESAGLTASAQGSASGAAAMRLQVALGADAANDAAAFAALASTVTFAADAHAQTDMVATLRIGPVLHADTRYAARDTRRDYAANDFRPGYEEFQAA